MKEFSVSELYFLCAVREKGKIYGYDTKKIICLLTAALWELEACAAISFTDQEIQLLEQSEIPPYLLPLYEHLKEMESLQFFQVLRDYHNALSDRHLNALAVSIGESLNSKGLVTAAKLGLFNGRRYYIPKSNAAAGVITEYLIDLLDHAVPSAEDGFLWLLLRKSSCVPVEISAAQQNEIDGKLRFAIKKEHLPSLQRMNSYLELLFAQAKRTSPFTN